MRQRTRFATTIRDRASRMGWYDRGGLKHSSRGSQSGGGPGAHDSLSHRRLSLLLLSSEARARRRQGADVRVLAAGPRSHPTASVGVAGSRAAPSRPRGAFGIHGSRKLSSRSRHRSGSLRTTRHHRTRAQLTTRSSAATADHSPGLRRLARVTRRRSPVMMLRRSSAGAIC